MHRRKDGNLIRYFGGKLLTLIKKTNLSEWPHWFSIQSNFSRKNFNSNLEEFNILDSDHLEFLFLFFNTDLVLYWCLSEDAEC